MGISLHRPSYDQLFLPVMVNFRYQPDWSTRCPDIWLSIFLGTSRKVFLDEISV